MRLFQLRNLLIPAMILLVLVNPAMLVANTDGGDAVAKLQQLRAAQNEHVKLATMQANSIDVSKRNVETGDLAFRKALKENTVRQMPALSVSSAPGIHRITPTFEDNRMTTNALVFDPLIHGQGKMTYASLDSLYFNFLTGQNGIDTSGMDVGLAIGTGMMFGDDGSFGNDSSLVTFYSSSAVLDDITIVPEIDDPQFSWADMSGEAFVGDIWIVYSRTSKCYVVLQITSTSESYPDEHIAFDYIIQTNGSNVFADISPLNITVNGLDADTLLIGSEPYFSITLDAALEGVLVVSWDRNHNGVIDTMDIPIEEYDFMDDDMHDLNPAVGVFDFIYDKEMADGLNYVVDDFLYTVYTADGSTNASVTYFTDPTPYYVSGKVRDILTNEPLDGVIVWGDYANYHMGPMPEDEGPTIIAISDTAGVYKLFFPDTGYVVVGTWDHLMTTGGLIPEPQRVELELNGAETVNFYYREPLARIRGFVNDEVGIPLVDIEVRAFHQNMMGDDGGGGDFYGYTDETGFYEIGVDPGWFMVELDGDSLIPYFMVPMPQELEVTETGANTADFVLLTPHSSIAGVVLLDGMPYPGAMIHAWNMGFGWNMTWADEAGAYEVPVFAPMTLLSDDGPMMDGYALRVHLDDEEFPDPVIQISENWNVQPGTTDETIILESITGGLYGQFLDKDNNEPILDQWEVGLEARNIDNDMFHWASPNPMDGSYQLHLPNGLYEIKAGGMDWYPTDPDTVQIAGSMIEYIILLDRVNYEGIFDGRILDEMTNNPIRDASVNIGNEFWGSHMMTDSAGYFHFELPNGYYGFHVNAPGYLDFNGDVDIVDNYVYKEIKLMEMVINGAIIGMVMGDAGPVGNANVNVWNPATDFGFHTMTEADGSYWFDLPNGIYDISVDHPAYLPYWDSGLWVSNDTLVYDVPLAMADGFISGRVFDGQHQHPIRDAGVWVTNMDSTNYFDFFSGVDDSGFFHIPVIDGTFEVHVDAPGYEHMFFANVVVTGNEVFLDVPLMKREFMGPHIYYVMDQPNDQGRWVRMQFGPDGTDLGAYMAYSIWRMTQSPMGPMYDFIAYVPSKHLSSYSLVAPTLVDSNAHTTPMEYETEFMITGHYDDWNFIDGNSQWGYSIDNIHPRMPAGFILSDIGSDFNDLIWDANTEDDFQQYELYRATNGRFDGKSPIAQLSENHFRDIEINPAVGYHYMLKAVDANGNASEGAIVMTPNTLANDGGELPADYSLSQNYPNPFNPTTLIEFALPEASQVSLEIYNLRGQNVRTLVSGYVPAGYLNVVWNGLDDNGKTLSSGTYIYQLKSADMSFTKKMVFMK